MRRSSVVAPLLLIGIGLLFLSRNLYPDLPLVDYLAKYWPVLLIIWGVLRLGEILIWAATDHPLPIAGISPGEWILVVFLCIFGVTLHTVRGADRWWPMHTNWGGIDVFGETFEYPISAEKASSQTPRVVIENFRGNARITGADVASVKVTGRKTIRSLDQSGADRANKDSEFELGGSANEVMIRNNQDRVSGNMRVTSEMDITVPKGATIEAHGRLGDFDISNVNGNVEIVSDNAGVRLQNIGGEVRIDTRKSDVIRAINVKGTVDLKGRGEDLELQDVEGQVTVAGAYSGVIQFRNLAKPLRFNGTQTDLYIEKLPGQVRMTIGNFTATNLTGPVRLEGRSRDVQISDFTNSLVLQVERGDIELRPGKLPLAKMDVHSRFGNVEMALPASAKFDINATTARGEAINDFGDPLRQERSGQGAWVRGSTGGPSVVLQTDRGRIVVRKSSADDKPFDPEVESQHQPWDDKPLPTPAPAKTTKPLQKVEQE